MLLRKWGVDLVIVGVRGNKVLLRLVDAARRLVALNSRGKVKKKIPFNMGRRRLHPTIEEHVVINI